MIVRVVAHRPVEELDEEDEQAEAPAAPVRAPQPIMRSVGPGGFLRQSPGEQQPPIAPAPPRRLVPAKPSAEIAGKTVTYIIRDDASDGSAAVSIAQRMLTEGRIDALIGPALTSSAAAVAPIMNAAKVPHIVTSPLDYDPAKQPYTFSAVQPVMLIVQAVVDEMSRRKLKTVAYIGFSDGFGDQVFDATKEAAAKAGI